jgi:glutamate/tyrosine decarboxylase-like PLP-dependent enzyme
MTVLERGQGEADLDPQDWDEFRRIGHRMLDDMVDYVATVRDRPAWQPVPDDVKRRLDGPVPRLPEDLSAVYAAFRESILPYPTGNIHPRFWGWVMGTGTPVGMLAELLAAGMNAHVAGYDQSAAVVEGQVIRWMIELLGFPAEASGVLVSGGTAANLVGLTVARTAKAGFDVRRHGLQGRDSPRLRVYASTQTHACAVRSCELLGLGREALCWVPVTDRYEIHLGALRGFIADDRARGHRPICVIGNAGTVGTAAVDDLTALAALCRAEGLWFHVDGTFGALAALSPTLKPMVAGIEQADSLAFDLHKWGYVQYEVGCALIRSPEEHRAAFGGSGASYLTPMAGGILPGPMQFAELGVQLSRGFRALKVWMSLKAQGADAWGRVIQQNVEQASYLAALIEAHPELELLAPVPLNIVCFRYRGRGVPPDLLNALNQEILVRLQESGIAVLSSTMLHDRFALRMANTNHRTRREDMDTLVSAVVELAERILDERGARPAPQRRR